MIHTTRLLSLVLAAAVLAGSAHSQGEVRLLRPAGGGGFELVAADAVTGLSSPGGPLATGLVPQSLELNGQSALDALDPDAGSSADLSTGGRIVHLPRGVGSVLLLRRDDGAVRYGWWLLDADGGARSLVERAGVGPQGDANPFLPRIAADPAGSRVLFATVPEAGGDLVVVPLAEGAAPENRTAHLPPLALRGESLLLGAQLGVATHDLGALVVPQQSGAAAKRVLFEGGAPPHVSGATVLSPRGMRAALVAGASESAAHAWVVDPDGTAICASDQAMELSGAGHLPEAANGPWLAVSDDGERCAWRAIEDTTSECYTARLESLTPQVEHETKDGRFIDTLGEAGVVGFLTPDRMLMGVGETAVGGGFDKVDLFEVHFPAGGGTTVTNLTASSGETSPPFDFPPTIESNTILRSARSDRVLIYDDRGSAGELLSVQAGVAGAQLVLDQVREFDWVRRVGDELWFSAELDLGSTRPRHLYRVNGDLSNAPTILLPGDEDHVFATPVVGSDWLAFVRKPDDLPTPASLERVFADGTHQVLIPDTVPLLGDPVALAEDRLGVLAFGANGPRGVLFAPGAARGYLLRVAVPAGTTLLGR